MFWKNKNKDKQENSLFKAPESARKAFRVAPNPKEPVTLMVGGRKVNVVDISSGGVAFHNIGCKADSNYKVGLALPHRPNKYALNLKILRIDNDNICRCIFEDIDSDTEDDIHFYVLERQKEQLQEDHH